LQILHNQFVAGYASRLEVAAQESQVAQVVATLPPLLKQLAQQKDLLATLSGGFPADGVHAEFDLSSLQLPQELPMTIPSRLVEQRPDLGQAEENLHAACAEVGIAAANRLPNITLTADAGTMALEAGRIVAGAAGFWTLAGSVAQPIFQGGTLMHRERAARDAYIQAADEYQSAVLNAFQNVADTLNALQQDADGLNAAAAAADAARVSLDITRRQLEAGRVNTVAFLNVEQTYQQASLNLIQARASRLADTVALFQALGGGWWNRVELSSQ
jgi:NodT family efflux transporter outer membrane factor (OMF) lipoprotein